MDKLLSFVLRFRAFFLFCILEVIAFQMILQKNDYQKSTFINGSNWFAGGIFERINNFQEFIALDDLNDSLLVENAFLRQKLAKLSLSDSSLFQESRDSTGVIQYRYRSAKVIQNQINRIDNFLIINKGMGDGITPKMGVLSSSGLVGTVKDVSYNYALVTSLLNSKLKIGAEIKNNQQLGTLQWNGKNHRIAQLNNISNYIKLKIGDSIITSGNSAIFPAGHLIGTILNFENIPSSGFYKIEVLLSQDMNALKYLYVVENKAVKELEDLKLNKDNR